MNSKKRLDNLKKMLKRCQGSSMFFINNFCKVKHPKAGIIPFNLFKYQEKSIKEFINFRFNIYRKTRQCFIAGSMVWTPKGPKPIETIKKGDKIYSLVDGLLKIVTVDKSHINGKSTRELYEVRTKTGHRSICSHDHKFMTQRGWVGSENLTTNDIITEINEPQRYGKSVPESDAILLGYLITDGCYGRLVNFTNTRWKYLLEFQKYFELKFGKRLKIRPHKSSFNPDCKGYRLQTDCKEVRKWLIDLKINKQTGSDKQIPEEVFSWDNKSIAIMINRMFAGDGWYTGEGSCNEAGIAQESIIILHQLKQLLTRFNIDSKFYPARDTSLPKLRIIGGKDFELFVKYIGIFGKKTRRKITKGFIFNRIKGHVKSVKQFDIREDLYDLTVPPSHNYIVDGAVVHNCGISTLTGAFALWYAMFFSNKKILIVSKRDEDAKEFLKKNVKFVYSHLPDIFKDIYGNDPPIYNEHTVGFPNGSVIRSLTSSENTMRSESASLNIIDEAAFMPHMDVMWSGAAPCCAYDTIISTHDGLKRIDKMLENAKSTTSFTNHNVKLPTDDGIKISDAILNNGKCKTICIKTYLGYEFEATLNHKIRIINDDGQYIWRTLDDVKEGELCCLITDTCIGEPVAFIDPDPIAIDLFGKKNNDDIDVVCCRCHKAFTRKVISIKKSKKDFYICPSCAHHKEFISPSIMTHELAEILGYYVGDGFLSKKRPKRIKLSSDPKYKDLPNKLIKNFEKLGIHAYDEIGNKTIDVRANNAPFIDWMIRHKLNSKTNAHDAKIPSAILESGPEIIKSFLRGLFDADGTSSGGRISYSTSSKQLANQVRTVLLSLGILTHTFKSGPGGYENSKGGYVISILDRRNCQKFMKNVGFLSDNKNLVIDNPKQEHGLNIDHPIIQEFCDIAFKKSINLKEKARIRSYKRSGRIPYQQAIALLNKDTKKSVLGNLLDKKIVFDKIIKKEESVSMTADLSVPENNTYIANGFVSHNTMQHGGSCIVISTCNGIGEWYQTTWEDAKNKRNKFNPIEVMWWDMDWEIKFKDEFTNKFITLSPTKGMWKCKTKEDIEKWGPYCSPWLEEQYLIMQQRGESHLFRQEVLAEFIGTGNTVLGREALLYAKSTVTPKYWSIGMTKYYHPITEQQIDLDFEHLLWVWKKPVRPEPDIVENGRIIKPGDPGHTYSMGVDISSGEAADYSSIEVIDCNTKEQVAELNIMVKPSVLLMMMDYIGRWYNGAFIVPERTGIGIPVCQSLYHDISYTNVFHMKTPAGKPSKKVGFPTNPTHKATINKCLLDHIGEDGVHLYSERCLEQLMIYIYLSKSQSGQVRTGHVTGPGNHSDMPIALGLALIGMREAVQSDQTSLLPTRNLGQDFIQPDMSYDTRMKNTEHMSDLLTQGGVKALVPIITGPNTSTNIMTPQEEIDSFTRQLGGVTIGSKMGNPIYRQKSKPTGKNI